ncbi:MAG TPA: DUF167 domain-containing protein [Tepidisphaeraceae bacterium]|nr:DUF167 domain-containing protein [Tepidisphaeraceae bacterium]
MNVGAAEQGFAREHPQGCQIALKVVPGASRSRIVGAMADGSLKVAVAKPPSGGQANAAVLALLAETLDMPARSLEIVSGKASARKHVLVRGLSATAARQRLLKGS